MIFKYDHLGSKVRPNYEYNVCQKEMRIFLLYHQPDILG